MIDVQNDFITGSLALKNSPAQQDGAEVVPVINDILTNHAFDVIVYTFDWHPDDHCSFVTNVGKYPIESSCEITADNVKVFDKVIYDLHDTPMTQEIWPEHCVQNSEGAELHADLMVGFFPRFLEILEVPTQTSYRLF